MRTLVPASLCLALAAALSPATSPAAEEKLKLGIFGNGKGTGPLLTRAELRDCLGIQERVRSGSEAAAAERERLEKDKAELVRQGTELKADLETLDRTSQDAIDQYKARAQARDQAIDEFEARSSAFNARIDGLKNERDGFQRRCDNRRFDQLDEAAIRSGK